MDHLDALVERAHIAGLPVLLTVEGTREALPAGIDRAAYQIVEDALTNALEQTNPAHAQVTIRYATDALQLEISDDRGTALATGSDTDLLAALRERAALYSGQIEARRRADGAYAVQARLPLRSST
jgi:signal transduction histidine kinase